METRKKCIALTKTGKSCRYYALKNDDYCKIHTKITHTKSTTTNKIATHIDFSFNEDCPICLEGSTSHPLYITSCQHKIHLECAKGMNSDLCPICRKVITNYPEDIGNIILKNKEKNKVQTEEEERERIIQSEDISIAYRNFVIMRATQRIEVMCALTFLREHHIPIRYIPKEISIKIDRYCTLPEGFLFETILNRIIDRIIQDSYIDDDNDSYIDDDDENPFDENVTPHVDIQIRSM